MIIRGGLVFNESEGFVPADLHIQNDRIVAGPEDLNLSDCIDATGLYLIPGMVDIHTHGAMGHEYCNASLQALSEIARYQLTQGVTSCLATSPTLSPASLENMLSVFAAFKQQEPAPDQAVLRGIYMEGPYLNPAYAGAQNPAYLSLPDCGSFQKLQKLSGDNIKVITLAPELPGAIEFIQSFSPSIKIALGHTGCNYTQAHAAFNAGASLVSHLFNTMAPFNHRAPALIGAASDFARFAELICDGKHLHPSVVRCAYKLLGPERIVLISDSMRATGLPEGKYSLGGLDVFVKDGAAHLLDGRLAGSVSSLLTCAKNTLGMGIPLEDVVRAATLNPARAVGIDHEVGSLTPGKRADVLLIDSQFNLKACVLAGKLLVTDF